MTNEHPQPRETPIGVGEEAPDFALTDQSRGEWRLSDHVKTGDVVICFFPMAFSSVCSTEMRCVTDEFERWAEKGATVVGVSCDSFFVHEAWAKSLGLKQTLLADMHRKVCKAYGFFLPDLNVASRGTVVIGRDPSGRGRVKWVQAREGKSAMKAEDVLAALG